MASEGASVLSYGQVEHFTSVIHGCREQEISGLIERNGPNRLDVVLESMGEFGMDKVPDLYHGISGGCGQMSSLGMEVEA